MQTLRFGRRLKLPSTRAIKHGILSLMLQDHLKAQALDTKAVEEVDTKMAVGAEQSGFLPA